MNYINTDNAIASA